MREKTTSLKIDSGRPSILKIMIRAEIVWDDKLDWNHVHVGVGQTLYVIVSKTHVTSDEIREACARTLGTRVFFDCTSDVALEEVIQAEIPFLAYMKPNDFYYCSNTCPMWKLGITVKRVYFRHVTFSYAATMENLQCVEASLVYCASPVKFVERHAATLRRLDCNNNYTELLRNDLSFPHLETWEYHRQQMPDIVDLTKQVLLKPKLKFPNATNRGWCAKKICRIGSTGEYHNETRGWQVYAPTQEWLFNSARKFVYHQLARLKWAFIMQVRRIFPKDMLIYICNMLCIQDVPESMLSRPHLNAFLDGESLQCHNRTYVSLTRDKFEQASNITNDMSDIISSIRVCVRKRRRRPREEEHQLLQEFHKRQAEANLIIKR